VSRDEEGLVDGRIDRSGLLTRIGSNGGRVDTVGRSLNRGVGDVDFTGLGLTSDQSLPGLVALVNDLSSVLAVFGLTGEGELVLGLSIGNFVDAEPFIGRTDETRKVTLDILNVVELGSERVVDIDDENLPVGLTFVEESHDTEDLYLLDLTSVTNCLSDFANVERVVITESLGFGVSVGRVLPSLRERSIVPDVSLVGETVSNETKFTLLGILEDGVELLLFRDFEFGVGPTGDLDDHVENSSLFVGEEGNVVERGNDFAILLDECTVLQSVLCTVLANGVLGSHVCCS